MTVFIGIDPGLSGALAFLWPDGTVEVLDTPTVKMKKGNDYLAQEMGMQLRPFGPGGDEAVATLEQGMAMPGQGRTSMLKIGRGLGLWEGILAAHLIPYELVQPQRWKRALGFPVGSDKRASRLYAMRLFPQMAAQLMRVKDDGRAEALLLAEWRRRQEGGSVTTNSEEATV